MERYWENGSGYYDPTATHAIEEESKKERKSRNKEIHDTINQIKNLLDKKGLKLINRIELKDKQTGKVYR